MFYIFAIVVLAIAAGAAFSPSFRQLLRIRSNNAISKGSTAVEKEKDIINQLTAKLPAQRSAVARVMAAVDANQRALDAKRQESDGLLKKYQDAKKLGASESALSQVSTQWKAAKDAIPTLEAVLAESKKNAQEAQEALNDTVQKLKAEEANIQTDEAKQALAAASRQNAQVTQQLRDMNQGLGGLADARRAVDADLDQARAEAKLAQGSDTDRELAALDKKAAATAAESEIEAALSQQGQPQKAS